jgi:hypothetical protein
LAGQGDLPGHFFAGAVGGRAVTLARRAASCRGTLYNFADDILADANALVGHLTLCVRYPFLILSNLQRLSVQGA